MPTKNMGIIEVSFELLEHFLRLPEGHKIVRVFENERWKRANADFAQTFEIVVEGPQLPEVPEGQVLPYIRPYYSNNGKYPLAMVFKP